MLLAGGVTTMEYATLIFALPVTVIAYLVMASFYKVLRMERAEREGQVLRRRSLTPPMPLGDQPSAVPKDAGDIQPLEERKD